MRVRCVAAAFIAGLLLAGCQPQAVDNTIIVPVEPVGGGKSSVAIEREPTLGGDLRVRKGSRYAVAQGTACPPGFVGIYRGNLYCG